MHFWQEYHRSNNVPFLGHHIRGHMMLTRLIIMMLTLIAQLCLLCCSTLNYCFPFSNFKYLERDSLFLLKCSPTILAPIGGSALQAAFKEPQLLSKEASERRFWKGRTCYGNISSQLCIGGNSLTGQMCCSTSWLGTD